MVIALPQVRRLKGGTPEPRDAARHCRLKVQLEADPDVARLAIEPVRPEERVEVRVQRVLLLALGVLTIAVAEPGLHPSQRLAVRRVAPTAAAEREVDRAVRRQGLGGGRLAREVLALRGQLLPLE